MAEEFRRWADDILDDVDIVERLADAYYLGESDPAVLRNLCRTARKSIEAHRRTLDEIATIQNNRENAPVLDKVRALRDQVWEIQQQLERELEHSAPSSDQVDQPNDWQHLYGEAHAASEADRVGRVLGGRIRFDGGLSYNGPDGVEATFPLASITTLDGVEIDLNEQRPAPWVGSEPQGTFTVTYEPVEGQPGALRERRRGER